MEINREVARAVSHHLSTCSNILGLFGLVPKRLEFGLELRDPILDRLLLAPSPCLFRRLGISIVTAATIASHSLAASASGAKAERPGLAESLEFGRPTDTLVVWRFDRLSLRANRLLHRTARCGSSRCYRHRSQPAAVRPRIIAPSWKGSSGSCAQARHGATCLSATARTRPSPAASIAGKRQGSGSGSWRRCSRRRTPTAS